jgi:hypothetical protein
VGLLFLDNSGVRAQDAEGQAAAMVQTVLEQLAAFRRDDWSAAYGYASSAIQARFPPEAFRRMVTTGYAAIARSARSTVLGTEVLDSRHGLVEIRVEGQDGQTVDALYELVEEQGAWRIDGVVSRSAEPGRTAGRRLPGRDLIASGSGAPRASGGPGLLGRPLRVVADHLPGHPGRRYHAAMPARRDGGGAHAGRGIGPDVVARHTDPP